MILISEVKGKEYFYPRQYISKDGKVKTYQQRQSYVPIEKLKEDELQTHIDDSLNIASLKVRELNKIEGIVKTILRYRGYNKKNFQVRVERLAKADQITTEDLSLVKEIMKRQNVIAGDLTNLLKFILKLYDVKDIEIKELTKSLKEYEEK